MADKGAPPGSSVSNDGPANSRMNILAKPRLQPSAFGSSPSFVSTSTNSLFGQKSVLRPSQLSANPFGRVTSSSAENDDSAATSTSSSAAPPSPPTAEVNSSTDKSDGAAVPKFVPLHSKEKVNFAGGTVGAASPSGLSRASGFVFGQNLAERIAKAAENGDGPSSSTSNHVTSNGTSELLFSTAVQASADSQSTLNKTDNGGSLEQSAQAWAKSRDTAPIVPSAPIITGEEGETNILQLNCRLFSFENGLWKERGRGQLRINDGRECSRIVCRVIGSLRVLLNTKIWGDMTVDKAGNKSLRLTATDSENKVKVFLVMASSNEINQLFNVISRRVLIAKKNEELESKNTSPDSSNDLSNKVDTTESAESMSSYPKETEDSVSNGENDEESQPESEEMVVSQSAISPAAVSTDNTEDGTEVSSGVKRPTDSDDRSEPPKKIPAQESTDDRKL